MSCRATRVVRDERYGTHPGVPCIAANKERVVPRHTRAAAGGAAARRDGCVPRSLPASARRSFANARRNPAIELGKGSFVGSWVVGA